MSLSYFIDLLNKILGRGCLLYGATPLKQLGHIENKQPRVHETIQFLSPNCCPALKCNVVICLFVVSFN